MYKCRPATQSKGILDPAPQTEHMINCAKSSLCKQPPNYIVITIWSPSFNELKMTPTFYTHNHPAK